jgi:hypothetical protein
MNNFYKALSCLFALTLPFIALGQENPNIQIPLCNDMGTLYEKLAGEFPKDYPAKHYTNQQLINKLVEIANNPDITYQEIESDFGLKFVKCRVIPNMFRQDDIEVKYVSNGQYPLKKQDDHIQFNSFRIYKNGIKSIGIKFDQINHKPIESKIDGCIRMNDVISSLDKKWMRHEPYTIIVNNYRKTTDFFEYSIGIGPIEKAMTRCLDYGISIHFSPLNNFNFRK